MGNLEILIVLLIIVLLLFWFQGGKGREYACGSREHLVEKKNPVGVPPQW